MSVADFDKAAVLTAFAASMLFIIGYSLIAPWWRQEVGRAMVFLDFGLSLALLPAMLRLLFHVNTLDRFFAWYYGASIFLVAGITLWRLAVIWHVQLSDSREQDDAEPHDHDEEPNNQLT